MTAGLHHHGAAPEDAGYTIGELAHLARSTVPAQRCVAFQTLGRVLYRLGRGEFGGRGRGGASAAEGGARRDEDTDEDSDGSVSVMEVDGDEDEDEDGEDDEA